MSVGGRPAGRAALSVVVPTRDRPERLDRCLDRLRAALGPDDELIVVDSASRDARAVADTAVRHGARLLRCDRPGVDRARNAGWSVARHDLVGFVDDDVEVDTGWADAFVAAAERHPEAAFVTGWLGVPPVEDRRWAVAVKDDPLGHPVGPADRGVLGHGASLLVRRRVLAGVGGWDEAMGAGARFRSAPELDLFDRVFAVGGVGWFEPAARAWHRQWRRPGQAIALYFRYGVGTGARVAKLARGDRRRAGAVAAQCWGRLGLRSIAHRLRHRDRAGALADAARLAGFVVGLVSALGTPVVDGHFRPRRPPRTCQRLLGL